MLGHRGSQSFREELGDRSFVEDLPFDGSSFDRRPNLVAELVETGGQQRVDRGRHLELSLSPAIVEHERHHLLDEKRIAFGGLDDTPPSALVERSVTVQVGDQLTAFLLGQTLQQNRCGVRFPPPQPGRSSSSSGRARQTSRIGASLAQSATYSTSSKKAGSPQWMSSKTTTRGCRAGPRLEQRPHREALVDALPHFEADHLCNLAGDVVALSATNRGGELRDHLVSVGVLDARERTSPPRAGAST